MVGVGGSVDFDASTTEIVDLATAKVDVGAGIANVEAVPTHVGHLAVAEVNVFDSTQIQGSRDVAIGLQGRGQLLARVFVDAALGFAERRVFFDFGFKGLRPVAVAKLDVGELHPLDVFSFFGLAHHFKQLEHHGGDDLSLFDVLALVGQITEHAIFA